jgi:hypothetical protein
MPDPVWFDALRKALAQRELPAAYAARLVDELSDHFTDLEEDQMSMDALESRSLVDRLGAPHEVARQAAREFARHSFGGRHPVLMFVVLPILVLAVGYVASLFGLVGAGRVLKAFDPAISSDSLSPTGAGLMRLLCLAMLLVPATLTAALFAWLAARAGVKRKWPIITGAIIGILVGLSQMDVYVSPLPGQSRLQLGLGFGTHMAFFQLAKFGVPMLVGLWIFSRRIRERSEALAS